MKKQFKVLLLIAMICVLAFATMLVSSALDQEQGENAWQVVGKGYAATLQAAIDGAEAGDTIKLLKDDVTETTATITKNLTIDGQGNKVSFTAVAADAVKPNSYIHVRVNAADVKVTNIQLAGTAGNALFENLYADGVLELNDVVVTGRTCAHVYWYGYGAIGSDLKITGAKTRIEVASYTVLDDLGTALTDGTIDITIDLTSEDTDDQGSIVAGAQIVYIRKPNSTLKVLNGNLTCISTAKYAIGFIPTGGTNSIEISGKTTITYRDSGGHYAALQVKNSTLTISGDVVIDATGGSTDLVAELYSTNAEISGNAHLKSNAGNNTYGAVYMAGGSGNISVSGNAIIEEKTGAVLKGNGNITISGNAKIVSAGAATVGAVTTQNGTITVSDNAVIESNGRSIFDVYGNVSVGAGVTLRCKGASALVYFAANSSVEIAAGATVELINAVGVTTDSLVVTAEVQDGDPIVGTFSMAAGAKFVLDGTPWIFDDEETPWGETVWGDYLYEIRSFLGVTLTDAEIDFTETFEDFDYAPFDPTGTYNKAQLNELIEAYILYYIITDQGFTSFATTDELAQYLQSSDDATANLTINLTGVSTFDILGAEITVVGLDGRYATTVFTVYSGSLTVTDSVVTAAAPFALADSEGRLNLVNTVLLIDGDGVVVFDATNTTLNGVTLVVPTTSTAMQPTAGHAAIDAYAPIVLFGGKEYKAWSVNKASNENASVTGAVAIYADTAAAETSGIRFSSTVSQDVITALTAGGKTLKYGTLVAPADYVAKAKSFTPAALDAVIDGTAYVKIPAVYSLVTGAEGVSFSGILVNLKSNTRVYAAVSYIEVYEGNELVDTIYSAYDAQFNAKSAEQLADAITLSDKYATLEAGQKAIVDAYANGKVEVVIPDPAA